MIWFTSDTHFGHANVLAFCKRPWDDVDAMNDALVERINERVAPDDVLYHLGDFSFRATVEKAREIRHRIRCRTIHWIPGNHDKDWSQPAVTGTFAVEPPICTLKLDGGRKIVMCHYPLMDWPGLAHGAIHLHGHIHAARIYNEWNRSQRLLRYDVGVDANGYAPVSLDEILAFFDGVEHRPRVTRAQWKALPLFQDAVAGAADDAAERDEIICDEMADLFERCADSYPVSERYLREVHDSPVKSGRNEREHMVIWFRANSTTGSGSFCRQKGNRSARTCYQRLQNAASLLWIAEAVGIDRATVERAFQAAVDKGDWRRGAGAIRSVIPWEAIRPLAAALLSPTDQGKGPTD